MTEETPLNLMQRAAEKLRQKDAPAAAPAQPGKPAGLSPSAAPSPLRTSESQTVTIDVNRLLLAGMVSPKGDKTLISEEYRLLKRPLLLKAFSDEGRTENAHVIMVSSSVPGEGKTFTAINLAMSIASEPDLNVLLVDGDVMNPSVLGRLGIEERSGLIDLLEDKGVSVSDVLLRCSNIPNLTILPAGAPTSRATELLASSRMESLVTDLARRYPDRVIIFDSPPVLASTEPSVIALHVGQIVLVVEAEKTPQSAIEASLRQLTACPTINLVLNKTRIASSSDEFGGYGYGYGQYGRRKA